MNGNFQVVPIYWIMQFFFAVSGYLFLLPTFSLPLAVLNLHSSFSFELQGREGGLIIRLGKFPTLSRDEVSGWTLD